MDRVFFVFRRARSAQVMSASVKGARLSFSPNICAKKSLPPMLKSWLIGVSKMNPMRNGQLARD